MSIICESSICIATLNYGPEISAGGPPTATWWTMQIDGLETSVMKDAMRSEYPELERSTHQNRLFFKSPENINYFDVMGIQSKTTQYLNSVCNLGYRLVTATNLQEMNSGIVQYQYCLQK